jgi:hypothetical protein
VDLRLPLMLIFPGVAQEITFPLVSVRVIIVLLNVAKIWATPTASTCFDFLRLLFLSGGKDQSSPFEIYFWGTFFLPAIARRGPLRVRAFVLVR